MTNQPMCLSSANLHYIPWFRYTLSDLPKKCSNNLFVTKFRQIFHISLPADPALGSIHPTLPSLSNTSGFQELLILPPCSMPLLHVQVHNHLLRPWAKNRNSLL